MQFTHLGSSGLIVSRICLGTMTYGTSKWRPWVLDEDATRPFIQRALELGINFFDTADMYSVGVSEEVRRPGVARLRPPRGGRHRDQGLQPDGRRAQRPRAVAASTSCTPSTTRCVGSAPTTSTSTRSTAGTPTPPSRRRWRRCTTW